MKVIVGEGFGCTEVYSYTRENIFKIVDLHREELEMMSEIGDEFYMESCYPLLNSLSTDGWLLTINEVIDKGDWKEYKIVEVQE